MKTIGLVGGMSWTSTALYYQRLNEEVAARLGGLHSANLLINSLEFPTVEPLQREGRWQEAAQVILEGARRLESAGADFVLIASNTGNERAEWIAGQLRVPLLHIVDVVGRAAQRGGYRTVGLLGTAYTMEMDFFKGRLAERFDLDVHVPGPDDRRRIHEIIYDELCLGRVEAKSRHDGRAILDRLVAQGAQAVVLGCTELPMLYDAGSVQVPLLDSTHLHVIEAVDRALG